MPIGDNKSIVCSKNGCWDRVAIYNASQKDSGAWRETLSRRRETNYASSNWGERWCGKE